MLRNAAFGERLSGLPFIQTHVGGSENVMVSSLRGTSWYFQSQSRYELLKEIRIIQRALMPALLYEPRWMLRLESDWLFFQSTLRLAEFRIYGTLGLVHPSGNGTARQT